MVKKPTDILMSKENCLNQKWIPLKRIYRNSPGAETLHWNSDLSPELEQSGEVQIIMVSLLTRQNISLSFSIYRIRRWEGRLVSPWGNCWASSDILPSQLIWNFISEWEVRHFEMWRLIKRENNQNSKKNKRFLTLLSKWYPHFQIFLATY